MTVKPRLVTLDRIWVLVLSDLGVDLQAVLQKAHLPSDLLSEDQVQLTVEEYFNFWRAIEIECADATLPLRMVSRLSTEAFHPAMFAALCSPNLHVAVRRISHYKRLVAPIYSMVDESDSGLSVFWHWIQDGIQIPEMHAIAELVYVVQIARIGTRHHVCPIEVQSPFVICPIEPYEVYFGITPQHGTVHGVRFSAEDAHRPFLTESESMWQMFEPELRRRLSDLDETSVATERVRSALLESLPGGEASIEQISKRLGVSTRTLQRNLKLEGSSYKEIVRSTRTQLALHYVVNTSMNFSEISFLLGFSEPSSFFRAFRDWTGQTPNEVRLIHRSE